MKNMEVLHSNPRLCTRSGWECEAFLLPPAVRSLFSPGLHINYFCLSLLFLNWPNSFSTFLCLPPSFVINSTGLQNSVVNANAEKDMSAVTNTGSLNGKVLYSNPKINCN